MLRYVERNPLRAGLVARAEDWRWSSAGHWAGRAAGPGPTVEVGPVPRPPTWLDWVAAALTVAELAALRQCVQRGRPYGTDAWAEQTATALGLLASLRPHGRPRKHPVKK